MRLPFRARVSRSLGARRWTMRGRGGVIVLHWVVVLCVGIAAVGAEAQDGGVEREATGDATGGDGGAGDGTSTHANASTPVEGAGLGVYPAPVDYGAAPISGGALLEGTPGAREHEGFFLRLQIGPGAGQTRYKERVDGSHVANVAAGGLSGTFDLSIGGRAVGNLIVHANLSYSRFRSPTRSVDGVKDAAIPVHSETLMIGAGVTYYFMPYNVFLTGSVGPAWSFEERPHGSFRSNTGFFLQLAPGKEWWVGPRGQWGLGAALRLSFAAAAVEVGGVSSTLKYGDIALAFSATFN